MAYAMGGTVDYNPSVETTRRKFCLLAETIQMEPEASLTENRVSVRVRISVRNKLRGGEDEGVGEGKGKGKG